MEVWVDTVNEGKISLFYMLFYSNFSVRGASSVVGIDWTLRGSNPCRTRDLHEVTSVQTGAGAHSAYCALAKKVLFWAKPAGV